MVLTFVAYYRVSTARQGQSGLGLEAQQEAVARHLRSVGGALSASFLEVESGKRNDRPKLAEALAVCRKTKATLIIAKLDRLARNVAFVSSLMESGTEFVAVDFPQANRLTVHILAAVAEHEARMISERTKSALAAARARGQRLGGPNVATVGQALCVSRGVKASAGIFAQRIFVQIERWHRRGVTCPTEIAELLTTQGIRTRHGRERWSARAVRNVLARVAVIESERLKRAA